MMLIIKVGEEILGDEEFVYGLTDDDISQVAIYPRLIKL
jgi:hypothetical protein